MAGIFGAQSMTSVQGESSLTRLAETEDQQSKKARTGFECNICGTSYTEKRTLHRHLKTPAHCKAAGIAIVSYSCRYCGQNMSRNDLRLRHENEVHLRYKRTDGYGRSLAQVSPDDQMQWSSAILNKGVQSVAISGHGSVPSLSSSVNSSSDESTPPPADSEVAVVVRQDQDKVKIFGESFDRTAMGITVQDEIVQRSTIVVSDGSQSKCANATSLDTDMAEDASSIRSVSSTGSSKWRLQLSSQLVRSRLIYRGASPRLRDTKLPVRCVQCQEYLGNSVTEIRRHLDTHPPRDTDRVCHTCRVAFKEADFVLHEASVAQGHCGFDFKHIEPCQGHHPPDVFSEMLTDNDRLRFVSKLQHWEYVQLRTYLDQVGSLVSGDIIPTDNDCWSMDALRSSLGSIPSVLGHRKPSSVPDLSDYLGRQANSLSRSRGIKAAAASAKTQAAEMGKKLNAAAALGDDQEVRRIILTGLDINAYYSAPEPSNLRACQPLYAAVGGGNIEIVKILISSGASSGALLEDDYPGQLKSGKVTSLKLCVYHDKLEIARLLLEHGANIDEIIGNNDNVFFYAIELQKLDTVRLFLEFGADPNAQEALRSPLGQTRNAQIVRLLLRYGANVNVESGGTFALAGAASCHNSYIREIGEDHSKDCTCDDIVKILLEHGADVNLEGSFSGSALACAAAIGRTKTVTLLLQHGADVNLKGGVYGSALLRAVNNSDSDMVNLLLAHRADVNLKSSFRNISPLEAALEKTVKSVKIIDVLIASAASQRTCGSVTAEANSLSFKDSWGCDSY